jgi:hypothetical protein
MLQALLLVVALIVLAAALLAFADFGRDSRAVAAVNVPKELPVAIDPDTNAVVAAAPLDARPKGIALGGGAIWVGVYDDNVCYGSIPTRVESYVQSRIGESRRTSRPSVASPGSRITGGIRGPSGRFPVSTHARTTSRRP